MPSTRSRLRGDALSPPVLTAKPAGLSDNEEDTREDMFQLAIPGHKTFKEFMQTVHMNSMQAAASAARDEVRRDTAIKSTIS